MMWFVFELFCIFLIFLRKQKRKSKTAGKSRQIRKYNKKQGFAGMLGAVWGRAGIGGVEAPRKMPNSSLVSAKVPVVHGDGGPEPTFPPN